MRVDRRSSDLATDREVGVVAAVVATGSEKAAAHRLGLSHSTVKHHLASARSKVGVATTAQLVWMLAARLADPESHADTDDAPGLSRAERVRDLGDATELVVSRHGS